jgi:hypothetical protein
MFDVTKCAAQEAMIDLGSAFRAFFEKRGRYPRFKREDGKPSFCAANEAGTFRTDDKHIKLPVIGWVRMREAVRFSGPLKRATVSFEGGFVSLMIETNDVQPVQQPVDFVGVDLGISTFAALSTGDPVPGPKAHAAALKRLRQRNKALARKRRRSANFRKAKARLTKLHARISAVTACGEARSGVARKSRVKRASTKQEEKTCCSGGGLMLTEISSYFRTVHPFRLESLSLPQKMPQKLHRIDPHQGPLRPRPVRSIRCKAGETP